MWLNDGWSDEKSIRGVILRVVVGELTEDLFNYGEWKNCVKKNEVLKI